jgi:hypothetical protein
VFASPSPSLSLLLQIVIPANPMLAISVSISAAPPLSRTPPCRHL